jgi:catechol 2,3-dioxygenase-like lactoylglutathione lyase family enzyme
MQSLSATTILVHDYDPAIEWFTTRLGFLLVEDMDMGDGKRWVTLLPHPKAQTRLVLARATNPAQIAAIGNQHGGRVGFFLTVDDFDASYHRMLQAGVKFREAPRNEAYGKVVVFEDLCGNGWDLLGAWPTDGT